jgi:glycosyltransferase involved in cell wall biosynthesis
MTGSSSDKSSDLVVFGTLPPPVTGMTLLTEQVVRGLRNAGPVCLFDWSTGLSRKGLKFRVARTLRVLRTFFQLLRRGRVSNTPLYLVANSGAGLFLTALFVDWARRLGYRVYLHHHVYFYIDRRDWRMAWIDRRMGPTGVHVVHCDKMIGDFRRQYDSPCQFEIVYPSIVSGPLGRPRVSDSAPFRLGHLSNLTIAKGLDIVVDTFEHLVQSGRNVKLVLAGPVRGPARRMLHDVLSRHPELIEYRGPLYGADKEQFFADIDVFLLPSRSESWGIVLHEAMCVGVPVVTSDRGCTSVVVGRTGGLVIDANADFLTIAASQIERWIDRPAEYAEASQAALEQAEFLQREGARTLSVFVGRVFTQASNEKTS